MIRLTNVTKSFDNHEVLHGIDLTVDAGKVVAIVGPSGSGKSTLLRCINFLERPSAGAITVGKLTVDAAHATAADILALRTSTAMVFQSFNLFKNLNVLDNVTLGLRVARKIAVKEARMRGEQMLEKVGLIDRLTAYPEQLSGGQQQRVAIARALALGPEVLLFDEPTSALDPELAEDVLECIKDVAREGNTMLLVTHEMSFAYDVAHEVVFIDEGRVVEQANAHAFFVNPQTDRTKQFLGNAMKRFIWAPQAIDVEPFGAGL